MFSPSKVLPFLDIVTNVVTEALEKAAFDANALSLGGQLDLSGFAAPLASKPIGKMKEQQNTIKEVTDFLKGEKGKGAALTMKTMVTAATPILVHFDELLTQPNLDKYSATLNTSPIVGLGGREIRYLNKTSMGTGAGTVTESWAHFDNLPAEADTTEGVVHMVPYNGSFCLSVGRSPWKKEPQPMTDAKWVDAKNDWPKPFISSKQHLSLKKLIEADAKAYEDTKDNSEKEKIQKRAVERGVKGVLKIAATINEAPVNASNAIVNMGVALRGIMAVLLILTFGVAAPAIVVGLGVLFIMAFIVNKVYESRESQMMSDIGTTQASVNSLETCIADLKKITPKFGELEIQYKALNMFWGHMSASSGDLLTWTADAFKELFEEMFSTGTIESARMSATELENEADPDVGALQAPAVEPSAPPSDEDAFHALLEAVYQPLANGLKSDAQELTVVSAGSEQDSRLNNIGALAGSKEFTVPNRSERSKGVDGNSATKSLGKDHLRTEVRVADLARFEGVRRSSDTTFLSQTVGGGLRRLHIVDVQNFTIIEETEPNVTVNLKIV
ncbi:hypothetical protein P154DRAFT_604062 [Amniculicola lignicola CBS 123094]|uniref:Uncharacterized protein n=1 Tax=Amniculicola lignicola CBS 123094 TaxID=1392246 RepID=A0A6A5W8G1_9PLEO|nr:hypothetical protein P154DRAFT_604062 [Amniculicola lignicola CBS 123094]